MSFTGKYDLISAGIRQLLLLPEPKTSVDSSRKILYKLQFVNFLSEVFAKRNED